MERDTFKELDSNSQVIVLFDEVQALPDRFLEKMEDRFLARAECEKNRKACAGAVGSVPWAKLIGLLVLVVISLLAWLPTQFSGKTVKHKPAAVSQAK